MKKCLLLLPFLLLLSLGAALANVPAYTVQNNVISMDFDRDGRTEYIELTSGVASDLNGFAVLNVSRGNQLVSEFRLMDFYTGMQNQTQIKVCPITNGSYNLLYIETHAMGTENVYSMWMIVSFENDMISFPVLVYDPGWTSGVALYEGIDPVRADAYQLYSADYDNYSEAFYLNTLKSRFLPYGFEFTMEPLSFNSWYSAAMLTENQYHTCAISVTVNQRPQHRSTYAENGTGAPASSNQYSIETTANVFLRKGAGTQFASTGVINKGTKVTYLLESAVDNRGVAWHRVHTGQGEGWISSKYVKNDIIDKLMTGSPVSHVVTDASLNVRQEPALSGKSLGTVKKGESFSFLGSIRVDDRLVAWFKVSYNGIDAWISSKYSRLN